MLGLSASSANRRQGAVLSVLPSLIIDGNVDGIADNWTLTVGTPANTPITPSVSGSGQLLTLATSTGAGAVTLAATVSGKSMSRRNFYGAVTAVQSGTYALLQIRLEYLNSLSAVMRTRTSSNLTANGTARQFFTYDGSKSPDGTVAVRMSLLADVAGAGIDGGLTFRGGLLGWL